MAESWSSRYPATLPAAMVAALSRSVEEATNALARFDERVARLLSDDAGAALAEGALARAHIFEAQALVGLMGGVAPLEDVVLNDAGMDARLPTPEIVKAASLARLRRSLARRRAEDMLADGALEEIAGVASPADGEADDGRAPSPSRTGAAWEMPLPRADDDEWPDDGGDHDGDPLPPLEADDDGPFSAAATTGRRDGKGALGKALAEADMLLARSRRTLESYNDLATEEGRGALRVSDPAYDQQGRLSAWRRVAEAGDMLPSVLAAAQALDAWLVLEPSEHRGEAGFLLAAMLLRRGGLAERHLPALALGYRRGRYRWSPGHEQPRRLAGLLAAIAESARAGQADLDRLSLARAAMAQRCKGRSRNSRLPQLVDLFAASPLVTVPMAAKRLSVTPQAVEAMLKELGPSLPREFTGRRRYRAWGVL